MRLDTGPYRRPEVYPGRLLAARACLRALVRDALPLNEVVELSYVLERNPGSEVCSSIKGKVETKDEDTFTIAGVRIDYVDVNWID